MAFTATILDKSLNSKGLLSIIVEFYNGDITVQETFQTTQYDDNWLQNQVAKKILDLESVYTGLQTIQPNTTVNTIQSTNTIDLNLTLPEPGTVITADIYSQELALLGRFKQAIANGLIDATTNQTYLNLRQWLRDNWQDDFVVLL